MPGLLPMIRSTVSTCLCRQRDKRVVDVDQLLGELVEIEPALGVAIDLEPRRGEGFGRAVAEIEPGALERADAMPRAGSARSSAFSSAARSRAAFSIMVEEVRLLEAEAELDLAELLRLEAGRGAEHVAELEIIDRRQRREHVPRQVITAWMRLIRAIAL